MKLKGLFILTLTLSLVVQAVPGICLALSCPMGEVQAMDCCATSSCCTLSPEEQKKPDQSIISINQTEIVALLALGDGDFPLNGPTFMKLASPKADFSPPVAILFHPRP